MNIQSLLANLENLETLIETVGPPLVFLSETCVTSEICDSEIAVEGYSLIRCDSHSRHTGGVVMFVREGIEFGEITNIVVNNNVWLLSINITKGYTRGIYTVLYHSPSASDSEFLTFFETWCEENVDYKELYIIAGDFNIDISKESIYSTRLKNIITANGMTQVCREYTRVMQNSKTLIDPVITNIWNAKVSVNQHKISDHETLEISIGDNTGESIIQQITILDKSSYTPYQVRNILQQCNWKEVNKLQLRDKTCALIKEMQACYYKLVKNKTITVCNGNPWFTNDLKITQREKNTLYKAAKTSNSEQDWNNYKHVRNSFNKQIKISKNKYIEKQIDAAKYDSKQMWKKLQDLVNNNTAKKADYINFPSGKETEAKQIAEKFNDYFIKSIEEVHDSIEIVNDDINIDSLLRKNVSSFIEFEPLTIEHLNKIINKMKHKASADGIDLKLVDDAMPCVGPTLLEIINESFQTGIFPDIWKTTSVTPIPKVNNTKNCDEFRPINMLPTLEKIVEHAAKEQLEYFLETYGVLTERQSGFRRKHSCETALNLVLSEWKEEVECNRKVAAVFLDLKRAFEIVDRDRLLVKLRGYGVRGTVLKWFKSYLTDRKQVTRYDGVNSRSRCVGLGVPQGSVLRPLLFVIYINDVVCATTNCRVNLFADDTLVSISDTDVNTAVNKLNSELKIIAKWLKVNKLKLNTGKTKAMVIYSSAIANINEKVDGENIDYVNEINYLGVIIDNKLSFTKYVDCIVKKVAKKINFFGRISVKLGLWAKILVYKTIIAPHFDYCSTVLFLVNEGDMYKLQKLQNRAMRVILRCSKYTKTSLMLDALQWLSIKETVYFNTLIIIFKIVKNLLPSYLSRFIVYTYNVHNYGIRSAGNFRLDLNRKVCSQNSLFYKGLKLFNNMPSDARQVDKISGFRKYCSGYVRHMCL